MTAFRALSGLLLSASLGIPAGLALGYFPNLYRHIALPLDFIRSIPSATLFPVFILAFGIGNPAKIAVVFYGCFFIIVVAAVYGGRGHPDRQKRIATLRSLQASQLQIFRLVVVPDAMASILGGLRIAASIAFVLVVVTEMFLGRTTVLESVSTISISAIASQNFMRHCWCSDSSAMQPTSQSNDWNTFTKQNKQLEDNEYAISQP